MTSPRLDHPVAAVAHLTPELWRKVNRLLVQQVLLRHRARMASPEPLQEAIDTLRARVGSTPARAILGQDSERHPGGVAIRSRNAAEPASAARPPLGDDPRAPASAASAAPDNPADKLRLRPPG